MEAQPQDPVWAAIAQIVSDLSGSPLADIRPESRLVDDLDMDSLGLAELAAAILDTFEVPGGIDTMLDPSWNLLTVRQLHERVLAMRAPAGGIPA